MINYELDGMVAVITGGAFGIGLACAHTMARSGADISVWDPYQDAVAETLKSLAQYGHRTHGVVLDIDDSAQVDEAMDDVLASLGRVDIAVCNANLLYPMRAAAWAMKATGGGSIINIASILGQVGFATAGAHAAARHAGVRLTQEAAWEHAADGVRVNAVGPGLIANQRAAQRLVKQDEVAELVAWLASGSSSFLTGCYLPMDVPHPAKVPTVMYPDHIDSPMASSRRTD